MNRARFTVLLLGAVPGGVLAQEGTLPPLYCASVDDRIPVLMIGTYHMSNPGLDRFNLEADDVSVPRRQAEVQRVADSLAEFRPTAVAVEAAADSPVNDDYSKWRAGERPLSLNETEQVGFRVAAAAGLEQVEAIDVHLSLPDESLGEAVDQDPSGANARRLEELNAYGEEAMRTLSGWLANGSIGEMLYKMNTPAALAWAHRPYVDHLLMIRTDGDHAGARYIAEWYRRNLAIFVNLAETAQSPSDRILVVYGQGHVPILRDLVGQHPDFCVEDPRPYLAKAR
jgi:Family of unknown function (DUF5694)